MLARAIDGVFADRAREIAGLRTAVLRARTRAPAREVVHARAQALQPTSPRGRDALE
jgi:hypothetical protein